jgi:hypothetical protein
MKPLRCTHSVLIQVVALSVVLVCAGSAEKAKAAIPAAAAALLPENFAGWQVASRAPAVSDAATADPAEAPLLKEFGFEKLETATYEQNGRQLKVKALGFHDATGALGAFLYYRQPLMVDENIGDLSSSQNEHVLFYRANVVVDAVFDKLSVMSASQLRELAAGLPIVSGGDRNPPNLPNYLPQKLAHAQVIPNSMRYAEGPVGLQRIGAPVSAELVDFAAGAEVVLSKYHADPQEATLTLIEYPTPQMAIQHQQRIDAAHQNANAQQNPGGPALVNLEQIYTRRTGPIVVVVSGLVTPNAARSLLGSVSYEPDVTWNERWKVFDKRENLGYLLVTIAELSAVLAVLALVLGIGFGLGRVYLSRLFPRHVQTYAQANEFISLKLDEAPQGAPSGDASPSRQAT